MPIRYVKGDLTKATEDVIAHGVNCQNVMGSGVALAISKKWPFVRESYLRFKPWKLGEVQFINTNKKWWANCATQFHYLPRGVCHADYDAIETCMNKLYKHASLHNLSVAMPKIGAGLAGGDWNKIEKIINRVFHDREITVYCLE